MAGTRRFGSEAEMVEWLRRTLPQVGRGLRLGIGDDAALVEVSPNKCLVLTADMTIEGVHFSRRLHPPSSVGHRALARALSDVAAMGGIPRFALVCLAIPRTTMRRWVRAFYSGLGTLAQRFGVRVVGGDTAVVSGSAFIDVVVAGEVNPATVLRRSGARAGDRIFVSGRVGESALGLRLLKSRIARRNGMRGQVLRAHLYPQPQCGLGRFLAEASLASALIDISDGLSIDLARLCEASGVGARVWEKLIPTPIPQTGLRVSHALLLQLALHGGEDYQLLFSVRQEQMHRLPPRFHGHRLYQIGEITASRRLLLVGPNDKVSPLPVGGYDHFRSFGTTRALPTHGPR